MHRLAYDLARIDRRRALSLIGGGGLALLVGCSDDDDTSSDASVTTPTTAGATATTAGGTAVACTTIPAETAGPFPGDGTNGPNVLVEDGVVRRDITSSVGSLSGTAAGVPLTVSLVVQDRAAGCVPLVGAAVYLWHCDREGLYSLYSDGATEQNYLRGLQAADVGGALSFQSIFPGAYPGRWPHIHFEVYSSLDDAVAGGQPIAISQLALPEGACREAYFEEGYEASATNLVATPLDRDGIFADGTAFQMANVEGDATTGYLATLTFAI